MTISATQKKVFHFADLLQKAGQPVTTRTVQLFTGGSNTTVQRHLIAWYAARGVHEHGPTLKKTKTGALEQSNDTSGMKTCNEILTSLIAEHDATYLRLFNANKSLSIQLYRMQERLDCKEKELHDYMQRLQRLLSK